MKLLTKISGCLKAASARKRLTRALRQVLPAVMPFLAMTPCAGQENVAEGDAFASFVRKVTAGYDKVKFDTLYIKRPDFDWTVKSNVNISGARILARGKREGKKYEGDVKSDFRGTFSAIATYRGLTAGFAVNPGKLAGKSKDNEFNLAAYGNKFGFEAVYLSSKTYNGDVTYDRVKMPVSKGMVGQKAVNFNAYYALNGKKFSYPAAFSQTYIQRRGAGSVLFGISVDGQETDISGDNPVSGRSVNLKIISVGAGAGYGYNFVPGKHWMLHVSAVDNIDFYVRSKMTVGEARVKMSYRFPDFIITGRTAAIFFWKNRFIGVTGVSNFSVVGDMSDLQVNRSKWRARILYGFRF